MMQESATYKFFSIYNMLYIRKSSARIINLGYRPILMMLEYIKYEHIYKNMIEKYDYKKHYEETIEVDCDILTGIKIIYINDPVNCLRTLFERGKIDNNKIYGYHLITTKAAGKGHLECLKYARKNGCLWDSTCWNAAGNGHLDCLRYARENGCSWDEGTCSYAALNGHLDCLKYARENGCPWDEDTCENAAKNGHLECLKYARENRCPWDVWTCTLAALNGHLDCLEYLRSYKCDMCHACVRNTTYRDECECGGHYEAGCPWNENTCTYAAEEGHLNCLKYAHENGCSWNWGTCRDAAKGGHLDCLKYAHENGCEWNETTCHFAVLGGHLDCLKYARENGCPWDGRTCYNAASYGHLDCLKYAHENGCPYNKKKFPQYSSIEIKNYIETHM